LESSFSMATKTCDGKGICLTQNTDCNTYGKYPDVLCEHNCQPISCPNGEVCGYQAQQWYLDCHRGTCWNCKTMFGKILTFVDDTDCPLCMETTRCVIQPNCTHPTCISCFKRCMYGEHLPEPNFPYPKEIEEQYYKELDESDIYTYSDINDKWHCDYPLLVEYDRQLELYNFCKEQKFESEKNLRKCPICRQ